MSIPHPYSLLLTKSQFSLCFHVLIFDDPMIFIGVAYETWASYQRLHHWRKRPTLPATYVCVICIPLRGRDELGLVQIIEVALSSRERRSCDAQNASLCNIPFHPLAFVFFLSPFFQCPLSLGRDDRDTLVMAEQAAVPYSRHCDCMCLPLTTTERTSLDKVESTSQWTYHVHLAKMTAVAFLLGPTWIPSHETASIQAESGCSPPS